MRQIFVYADSLSWGIVPLTRERLPLALKFAGADVKCAGLGEALEQVCHEQRCHFFDAATVVSSSELDGVHLDMAQHVRLGSALAPLVSSIAA